MRHRRVIFIGILCVLSVISAAYGQDPSDSGVITVTKDIDVLKLAENVEELNRNMKTLTETIDALSANVKTLNETVTRLDERTKGIAKLQYVILGVIGTIFASMVVFFLTQWHSYFRKTNSKSDPAHPQASLANQGTAASTNPAQINETETAPTSIVPSEFPEGQELEATLKSNAQATREKA